MLWEALESRGEAAATSRFATFVGVPPTGPALVARVDFASCYPLCAAVVVTVVAAAAGALALVLGVGFIVSVVEFMAKWREERRPARLVRAPALFFVSMFVVACTRTAHTL